MLRCSNSSKECRNCKYEVQSFPPFVRCGIACIYMYGDFAAFLSPWRDFFQKLYNWLCSAIKGLQERGGLCYDEPMMKSLLMLSLVCCLVMATWAATPSEKEHLQQQTMLLHDALRGYDMMTLDVQETAEGRVRRYVLSHVQAEEMAQALIMLRSAEQGRETLTYPQYRLNLHGVEGEYFVFDLSLIVPEDEPAVNYILPVVEYERMRAVIEELEENARAGMK